MTRHWHTLILEVGSLEQALAVVLSAVLMVSLLLAAVGWVAWRVAKRLRPRREVEREARERRRYLQACVDLTENRRMP